MFESAELGHCVDKAAYEREVPALREALLNAQFDLETEPQVPGDHPHRRPGRRRQERHRQHPQRVDGPALHPDPRHQRRPRTRSWSARTCGASGASCRPRGASAIFDGSWYAWPIFERAYGRIKNAELDQALEEVRRFEQMLIDEGALILKFWMHLSKEAQKKRLKKLEARSPHPLAGHRARLEALRAATTPSRRSANGPCARTSTAAAPWIQVEAVDPRYQKLTVGKTLLEHLRRRLDDRAAGAPRRPGPPAAARPGRR